VIPGRAAVTATAMGVAIGDTLVGSMAANDLEYIASTSLTDSVGTSTENKGTSISKGGDKMYPSFFVNIG
jgi:hypothetical protein